MVLYNNQAKSSGDVRFLQGELRQSKLPAPACCLAPQLHRMYARMRVHERMQFTPCALADDACQAVAAVRQQARSKLPGGTRSTPGCPEAFDMPHVTCALRAIHTPPCLTPAATSWQQGLHAKPLPSVLHTRRMHTHMHAHTHTHTHTHASTHTAPPQRVTCCPPCMGTYVRAAPADATARKVMYNLPVEDLHAPVLGEA